MTNPVQNKVTIYGREWEVEAMVDSNNLAVGMIPTDKVDGATVIRFTTYTAVGARCESRLVQDIMECPLASLEDEFDFDLYWEVNCMFSDEQDEGN